MKANADRNPSRFVPLALLAWLAAAVPVQAATVCVSPGGAGGCFASLQSAVDAAAVGDVVEIAAGTYVESVQMPRKRLTLRGAGATTTIIDDNGTPAVVRFSAPASPTVCATSAAGALVRVYWVNLTRMWTELVYSVIKGRECPMQCFKAQTSGDVCKFCEPFRTRSFQKTDRGHDGGAIGQCKPFFCL